MGWHDCETRELSAASLMWRGRTATGKPILLVESLEKAAGEGSLDIPAQLRVWAPVPDILPSFSVSPSSCLSFPTRLHTCQSLCRCLMASPPPASRKPTRTPTPTPTSSPGSRRTSPQTQTERRMPRGSRIFSFLSAQLLRRDCFNHTKLAGNRSVGTVIDSMQLIRFYC